MAQGIPVGKEQTDLEHEFPEQFEAGETDWYHASQRRLQLLSVFLLGWITQNISWGVSLAIHSFGALLLGLVIVPMSLGHVPLSLDTQLGSGNDPGVGTSDTGNLNEVSAGGAPIDLAPVAQSLGDTGSLEALQMNLTPDIQAVMGSEGVEQGLGGTGTGIGTAIGPGNGDGANGKGGGGGGGVEFFGTKGTGESVVFVVDISGSMVDNDRFERARSELLKSIEKLKSTQRFFVVFYNGGEIPLFAPDPPSKLLVATRAAKNKSRRWINSVRPGGGTQPISALDRALRMKPDMIYLMTDGEIPEETRDFLKEQNRNRVTVHTIAFQSLDGQAVLKEIAEDNKGKYRYVP